MSLLLALLSPLPWLPETDVRVSQEPPISEIENAAGFLAPIPSCPWLPEIDVRVLREPPISEIESAAGYLLPAPVWGFEQDTKTARRLILIHSQGDVFPAIKSGSWGFEQDARAPRRLILPLDQGDVFPAIKSGSWGFEQDARAPRRLILPLDQGDVFPAIKNGSWGFETDDLARKALRTRPLAADYVLPGIVLTSSCGYEAPEIARARKYQSAILSEVFPALIVNPVLPWGFDTAERRPLPFPRQSRQEDDFWPSVFFIPPLPPAKGGGDLYCRDDEFEHVVHECLENVVTEIDQKLYDLVREDNSKTPPGDKSPIILPPGWKSGNERRSWNEDNLGYTPPRQGRTERKVTYNFAANLDDQVRRKVAALLEKAGQAGLDIYGSDAFVSGERARVHGLLVRQGTNAWVLELARDARVILAKSAVAEGFKLVSYDDNRLGFIYTRSPWKEIFTGVGVAAAGITLLGAGVGVGYIVWGRRSETIDAQDEESIIQVRPRRGAATQKRGK